MYDKRKDDADFLFQRVIDIQAGNPLAPLPPNLALDTAKSPDASSKDKPQADTKGGGAAATAGVKPTEASDKATDTSAKPAAGSDKPISGSDKHADQASEATNPAKSGATAPDPAQDSDLKKKPEPTAPDAK